MNSRTMAVGAVVVCLLAGCDGKPSPTSEATVAPKAPAAAPPADLPPFEPPAPGQPGGLPDDRTPISEAPFTPQSAQGAADVVQVYFALLHDGRHAEARKLWARGGTASGMDDQAFAASFGRYASYQAHVGAPGAIEGAAGSSFIEVPVQVFGRLKSGEGFNQLGVARLRRVNEVPGSTAEQRLWRIEAIELKTAP